MAFNGSGTFVRLYSWVNDAAANIKIRADRMDNEMNGFSTGLSTCITKDGQTTVTANLPMANFRHTGVGAGASRTDYTRLDQAQDGKLAWVAAGGTADAITATYGIPITALVDGQLCYVRAGAANATTTPTFSPSALTARTIVKDGGAALLVGDISGAGHELILRYDLTNTRWELLNPKARVLPYTAASSSGAASLGFAEDTDNGTNVTTLRGAAAITGAVDITLPAFSSTLATLAGTETFTNKTVTNLVANGTLTGTAIKDEDNMSSDSATAVPTQQSVKAYVDTYRLNIATPQATTSGTSIDFTGIPSTVKKITINFVGVSTNGSDDIIIQIGDAGGVEASGYLGASTLIDTGVTTSNFTAAFGIRYQAAAGIRHGSVVLTLQNSSTNTWCAMGTLAASNIAGVICTAGSKSLSATLDRVRITTSGGANTFDAGEINISYA